MTESAENKNVLTQKSVIVTSSKTQETGWEKGIYLGKFDDREGLKSYLELQFTLSGLKDRIAEAKVTIDGESSWRWYARNSVSAGLAAFTADTWNGNCRDIGIYRDLDPFQQIRCLTRLWKRGEWGRWDVWCSHYNYGNTNKQCRGLYPK